MEANRYLKLWQTLEPHMRLQLQKLVSQIEANGYTPTVITQGGDEEFWLDVDFKRDGQALGGFRLQLMDPDVHGEEFPSIDLVQQGASGRHLMGYRISLEPHLASETASGSVVEHLFDAPHLLRDSLYRLFLEPTEEPADAIESVLPF